MSDPQLALVTGGAGFIGSHLVRGLLGSGWQVRVLDDLSSGDRSRLEDAALELVVGDVRRAETVADAVNGASVIFHLAALVSVPDSELRPVRCYEVNVQGSLNVLQAARDHGVERVVLVSSAAVYGESSGPVSEGSPANPHSPYAASKLLMERAGLLFHHQFALPVVALRFFNVYGPGQSADSSYAAVIPAFIQARLAGQRFTIYGSGEQRRDFVHVADAARACMLAAESEQVVGQAMNIGSGEAVSVIELAEILHDAEHGSLEPTFKPRRAGDIDFSQADIHRARRFLSFAPEISLPDGLDSTLEWFRQVQTLGNP